jgi:hypothetical protein
MFMFLLGLSVSCSIPMAPWKNGWVVRRRRWFLTYRTDKMLWAKIIIIILNAKILRILLSFDAEMSKPKTCPVKVGKGINWLAKQDLLKILKIFRGSR